YSDSGNRAHSLHPPGVPHPILAQDVVLDERVRLKC
ncbi:hypothetical protein HKBW3S09_01513, partial [Candidatus Hakubella thermalkaliphila]